MLERRASSRVSFPRRRSVDGQKKSPSLPSRRRSVDRVGQGCDKKHPYHKRGAGFLVIKIQEHFQFIPHWYRQGEVRAFVGQYYVVLRTVLRTRTELRRCVARCRHCRIFFLTHPRNAGRRDLGCPFGCKEAHRKRRSIQRSVEYYSTEEGKTKKKIQNGKRGPGEGRADPNHEPVRGRQLERDGILLDVVMVGYVRMVTSLIEGWRVSEDETVEMLVRAMRQHSIARRRRMDYVLAYLKKNAP